MKGHGPSTFSINTPTSLSVLVPVYNEQYLVYASLERLKILAESPLLERIDVIVVDDGSTDQTMTSQAGGLRENKQVQIIFACADRAATPRLACGHTRVEQQPIRVAPLQQRKDKRSRQTVDQVSHQ